VVVPNPRLIVPLATVVGAPSELDATPPDTLLNEPTLNVLQMESGGGFSAPGRTAIPASATARIAMRLVHGLDPQKMNERVIAHVRKQGYFVVLNRDPTDEERLANPLLARIDARGGSRATRVTMDEPLAQSVAKALTRGTITPVQLPTLGGSMPFGGLTINDVRMRSKGMFSRST